MRTCVYSMYINRRNGKIFIYRKHLNVSRETKQTFLEDLKMFQPGHSISTLRLLEVGLSE